MAFPKKISELPVSGLLKNTDLFVTVNNDITSKTTLGEITASISGHTIPPFTGNTSGDCINELWVSTISGCSPVYIGPELIIDGSTTFNGDIDLCPTGTIYCSSFSGCSPIHFHAPVEFDNSITVSADEEVVLDFSDANEILIPTYVLKHCKGTKSDIVTFQNFADYVGKIVTLASEEEGVKWEVTLQPTLEVTSIVDCCFDNYILTNCVTSEVYGIVNYEKWDGSSWVGTIIKIENDDGEFCYGVTTTCDAYDIDEKIEVVS